MAQEPRKVMRLPEVMRATGWSPSTVYDKIKAGKFPKPFKPDPMAVSPDGSRMRSPNFKAALSSASRRHSWRRKKAHAVVTRGP
jgi:Prophage CP4-57 regulatory protein (AlpA)